MIKTPGTLESLNEKIRKNKETGADNSNLTFDEILVGNYLNRLTEYGEVKNKSFNEAAQDYGQML